MPSKIKLNKKELKKLYCNKLYSICEIVDILNVAAVTVSHNLKEFNIKRTKDQEFKFKQKANLKLSNKLKTKEVRNKKEQTWLTKYNVTHPAKCKEIQEKKKKTDFEKYGTEYHISSKEVRDKSKQTCLNNFEVDNIFKNKEYIKKAIQKKYGLNITSTAQLPDHLEKVKKTCLKKYGVNYFNNIEKQKETVFNKYGVQSVSDIPEVKIKKKAKLKESKKKEYIRKKQNNSFNKSKPEEYFYNYLLNKYSKEDIVRQYRDERYPFACDFYIKSQDLFIELNLTWTHGGHAFNKQNKEDLHKLKKWKDKSSNSDFYKNAIYTWTDLDVRKLNYMLENNLNFKIYYSIKEIQELIV